MLVSRVSGCASVAPELRVSLAQHLLQLETVQLRSQLEEATHASTPVRQQVLEDASEFSSHADAKQEASSSSEPLNDQDREAVKLAHSVDACTSVEQVKASHPTNHRHILT